MYHLTPFCVPSGTRTELHPETPRAVGISLGSRLGLVALARRVTAPADRRTSPRTRRLLLAADHPMRVEEHAPDPSSVRTSARAITIAALARSTAPSPPRSRDGAPGGKALDPRSGGRRSRCSA